MFIEDFDASHHKNNVTACSGFQHHLNDIAKTFLFKYQILLNHETE